MDFPALERTGFDRLLSDVGRRVFTPQGIFYWSARAKAEGKPGLNGTIGSAFVRKSELYDDGDDSFGIAHLPSAKAFFPDFDPAEIFAYAPICGVAAFREAWRKWIVWKGGEAYSDIAPHLTQPIVTPGITGAISIAARLFLNPGERIVCPIQRWANYDTVLSANLGIGFAEYPHFKGEAFNTEGFVTAIEDVLLTNDKAVAILNFPNNPTGYNPTLEVVRDELVPALSNLVREQNKPLVVMFDDAYEGYAYDDESMRVSPFYEFVNVDDRILPVKLDGISKEMLWYGGRVGCITFGLTDEWLNEVGIDEMSKELDNKIGGMIRGTVSNNPHVVQAALTKLLADPEKLVAERAKTVDSLKARWVALQEAMKALPSTVTPDPYQGGFFLFLNLEGVPAREVAERLLVEHGVTVVPSMKPEIGLNGLRMAYCGIEAEKIPTVIEAVSESVSSVAAMA